MVRRRSLRRCIGRDIGNRPAGPVIAFYSALWSILAAAATCAALVLPPGSTPVAFRFSSRMRLGWGGTAISLLSTGPRRRGPLVVSSDFGLNRRRVQRIAPWRSIHQASRRHMATDSEMAQTVPSQLAAGMDNSTVIIDASKSLRIYHLQRCVDSTQDEAKRLLEQLHRACNADEEGRLPADSRLSASLPSRAHLHSRYSASLPSRADLRSAPPRRLVVIADTQSQGRGTSGRSWVATAKGNLYMTFCLPMHDIAVNKLTLLPIGIGVLVADTLDKYIATVCADGGEGRGTVVADGDDNHTIATESGGGLWAASASRPAVKWPNDVLLDGRKVAGTLIENCRIPSGGDSGRNDRGDEYWLLVGVGVNIESHPTILLDRNESMPDCEVESAPERPTPHRLATSLRQHCDCVHVPSAVEFGIELASGIEKMVVDELSSKRNDSQDSSLLPSLSIPTITSNKNSIVDRWKSWTKMGEFYTLRGTGERVRTVDIEADGQLRVCGEDGRERLLVSDYFV